MFISKIKTIKMKRTKTLLRFFICLVLANCITILAHAQNKDSLARVYNNETIQTYGRFFIKGSKRLTFGELKNEFSSGITKDLYKKAKGQRALGGLCTVTAVAALVTGAVLKKQDKNGALPFTILGVALNLGGFNFRNHSTQLLDRAIWQRNKEVLFGVIA